MVAQLKYLRPVPIVLVLDEVVAATVIKSINRIPSNCCSVKSGTYASNTIGHPILSEVSSPWSNGLTLFGYSKINDLTVE